MTAFRSVLKKLEREGKFDSLEDNDLRCDKCGRMACTIRGSSEGETCYARIGDLSCTGILRAVRGVDTR